MSTHTAWAATAPAEHRHTHASRPKSGTLASNGKPSQAQPPLNIRYPPTQTADALPSPEVDTESTPGAIASLVCEQATNEIAMSSSKAAKGLIDSRPPTCEL